MSRLPASRRRGGGSTTVPSVPAAVAASEIFAGDVKVAPLDRDVSDAVGAWFDGGAASAGQGDHLGHRRDAGGVHDEEHVDAWDGGVLVWGDACRELAFAGCEAEREVALLHLDRVGLGPQPHQPDLPDRTGVRRADLEGGAVADRARGARDLGTRGELAGAVLLEQVGRREDLGVLGQVAALVAGAADTAARGQ